MSGTEIVIAHRGKRSDCSDFVPAALRTAPVLLCTFAPLHLAQQDFILRIPFDRLNASHASHACQNHAPAGFSFFQRPKLSCLMAGPEALVWGTTVDFCSNQAQYVWTKRLRPKTVWDPRSCETKTVCGARHTKCPSSPLLQIGSWCCTPTRRRAFSGTSGSLRLMPFLSQSLYWALTSGLL